MKNVQATDSDTSSPSVKDNTVEAEVGGSVTVPCFYSDVSRDKEKKWCRGRTESSC
ncbi:hypothetical protein GN956_G26922, partial [Arapaima gigas]